MADETQELYTPADIEGAVTLSFDEDLPDYDVEFLGVIAIDSVNPRKVTEKGEFPPQWHLAVKPVDGTPTGPSGFLHANADISRKPNRSRPSKLLHMLDGMKVFKGQVPNGTPIGYGHFVGQVAWFQRKDIQLGTNSKTGQNFTAKDCLIAVRLPTDEERAMAAANYDGVASGPSQYSVEDQANLVEFLEGKSMIEAVKAIKSSDLSAELKKYVISGQAIEDLQTAGVIELDDEEKVRIPVASAA